MSDGPWRFFLWGWAVGALDVFSLERVGLQNSHEKEFP